MSERSSTDAPSKASDALRDDAMKVAMDLGREKLISADGAKLLVEQIDEAANLNRGLEATELFQEDGTPKGVLSRQPGESMMS